ncbi:MAG: hypothetical protein QGH20_04065 [Candidatus Latescibacteria bacterium]|nr:hypothetical protein [Candidatus Latescibacterota bacterium]
MATSIFNQGLPKDFDRPTELPQDGDHSKEWASLVSEVLDVEGVRTYGCKRELFSILPIPESLREFWVRCVPNIFTRTITNGLGLGTFLVSTQRRPE